MWAQWVTTVLGVWLMFAPAVLGYAGTTAGKSDRFVGPLVASFAFVAVWRITRGLRWMNLLTGLWLLVAPWVLGFPFDARANSTLVGAAVLALAPLGGIVWDRFAGGWQALLHPEQLRRE